mgnify:CR=1 FL=1
MTTTTTHDLNDDARPNAKHLRQLIAQAEKKGLSDDPRVQKMRDYLKAEATKPTTSRCRLTGAMITVCTAEDAGAGMDGGELPWFTVCDTHGACVGHTSRRLATQWAAEPSWCPQCTQILKGKKPMVKA